MEPLLNKTRAFRSGSMAFFRCRLQEFRQDRRGGLLMEALVATSLFAVVGGAVLAGLQTTHSSGFLTERQSVAESLARTQMETMFSQSYVSPPGTCPVVAAPTGYTIACDVTEYEIGDPNVALVTVTVSFGSEESLKLEALRSN